MTSDEFFEEAIKTKNWTEEEWLHARTFDACLKPDGTLKLLVSAPNNIISQQDAQALTRYLSQRVKLPPVEPPYDFKDFKPKMVILGEGGIDVQ